MCPPYGLILNGQFFLLWFIESSNCSKSYWYLLIPPLFEIIVLYALPFFAFSVCLYTLRASWYWRVEFLVVRISVFFIWKISYCRSNYFTLIVKPLFIGVFWFSFWWFFFQIAHWWNISVMSFSTRCMPTLFCRYVLIINLSNSNLIVWLSIALW